MSRLYFAILIIMALSGIGFCGVLLAGLFAPQEITQERVDILGEKR